ncbi:MAG: LAGLIDADG family homing endonuclease, partial [bacterium]|nr:LAGLIDADG family homing endonuclease [bacterium]
MRKILSKIDRAYLAGLIDGDGAIMACIEKHKEKKFGFRVRIAIKISQNNDAVLKWSKRTIGFGHIRHNRTQYEWYSLDQLAIEKFLKLMVNYLKVKQKQAKLAIKIIRTKILTISNLIKVAKMADQLSKFNVRSAGRRKNFARMIEESISPND